jgi:hypothetical protein
MPARKSGNFSRVVPRGSLPAELDLLALEYRPRAHFERLIEHQKIEDDLSLK